MGISQTLGVAQTRPVGVRGAALIALAGAPPPEPMHEALAREIVGISLETAAVFDAAPAPGRPLVVIWAPADIGAPLCQRIVSWADRATPRLGLLGHAPEGSPRDTEDALAAGFDDFVIGEVGARELAARTRAVFRRLHWSRGRRPGRLRFGPLVLHPGDHEVFLHGRSVVLTGIEQSVLRALMQAGGRALSRAELLDQAWGEGSLEVSERAVDNVILRLRRKLGAGKLIRTIRGVGFRLDGA